MPRSSPGLLRSSTRSLRPEIRTSPELRYVSNPATEWRPIPTVRRIMRILERRRPLGAKLARIDIVIDALIERIRDGALLSPN